MSSSPLSSDVPSATLLLGSSLNASNIKEGDDVYFECGVKSNPRPYKITWKHNVSLIYPPRDLCTCEFKVFCMRVEIGEGEMR